MRMYLKCVLFVQVFYLLDSQVEKGEIISDLKGSQTLYNKEKHVQHSLIFFMCIMLSKDTTVI